MDQIKESLVSNQVGESDIGDQLRVLKLNINEMVNIDREHSEELSHIIKYITDREAQDLLEITMRSV